MVRAKKFGLARMRAASCWSFFVFSQIKDGQRRDPCLLHGIDVMDAGNIISSQDGNIDVPKDVVLPQAFLHRL